METNKEEDEFIQLEASLIEKDSVLIFLKRKLDKDIGYNYWKKYVSCAFWAQISTPINLIITFLTAITTAQAQTKELISPDIFSQIAIVSLIITTLNTFFRPHTQYATNTEYLGKWIDIGVRFEKEYCDKVNTNIISPKSLEKLENKIEEYKKIQDEVINLRKIEGSGTVNFITDLIFLICYSTCIRKNRNWLDNDKKIEQATRTKMSTKRSTLVRNTDTIIRTSEVSSETPPTPAQTPEKKPLKILFVK